MFPSSNETRKDAVNARKARVSGWMFHCNSICSVFSACLGFWPLFRFPGSSPEREVCFRNDAGRDFTQ